MYHHIMVLLDGSKLAECVLPHVQEIAGGCNVNNVTLVRVVEPLRLSGGLESRFSPEERKRLEDTSINLARDYLDQIKEQLKDNGVMAEYEVLHGDVADKIVDYAGRDKIDLIIMATHGHSGISRWVWGSTADRILRSCSMPVLVVRAPGCAPGI